jgi:hypothetical protein
MRLPQRVHLAVARAFGMEFWTTDQRLLRTLAGRFPEARFLGDYPLLPPAPLKADGCLAYAATAPPTARRF